jgi:predicted transcriptional regulator
MDREKVNSRIKNSGYKKKFIAEKIGVHQVVFSYYLKGERDLPIDKEQKLKMFLGL